MAANQSECTEAVGGRRQVGREPTAAWDPTDTFDPAAGDVYRYPGELGPQNPGTGFKAPPATPNDYATEITLKVGNPADTIHPGWFQALDLSPAADSTCINDGAECYETAIVGCAGGTWKIGDMLPKETGNMVGPTSAGRRRS